MSIPSNTQRKHIPIGKYFLETGRITAKDLDRALLYKHENKCKLGQALVSLGLVSEDDLLKALRAQGKFHCVRLSSGIVDFQVARGLSEEDAQRFRCLPINRIADTVTVAMEDPTDVYAIDELAVILESKVFAVFAEPSLIRQITSEVFGVAGNSGGISLGSLARASESSMNISRFSPVDGLGSVEYEGESTEAASAEYPTFSELPEVPVSLPMYQEPQPPAETYEQDSASSPTHGSYEPTSRQEEPSDDDVSISVKRILAQAIAEQATDVHLEPREGGMLVRFRIDGAMQDRGVCSLSSVEGIIGMIKELADLDPAQRGFPQEGRARIAFDERRITMRVATAPTVQGEGLVLHFVDRGPVRALEEYDFNPEQLEALTNAIECRHGIVLATGPSGSGKSSILYSILQRFHSSETKIVTLEDPVERIVDGVTQINVDPRHGFGYAAGLRSVLRQDPDILLLGEIPDEETAKSLIQVANFGQLALSSMHALTAAQAVSRLVERGVERYLLADTLRVVVAQRLLRRVCESCREPHVPEARILSYLGLEANDAQFFRGSGCEACHGTGYKGRVGVYEIMQISPALRELIAKGASTEELSAHACSEGMTHLRSDAIEKARAGMTTLQEVLAATSYA